MDMNRLKDGIREKVNTVKMLAVFCTGLLSIGMTACDDGLDVTQAYPFTAEIRCELVREGEFDGAVYTIRYFQFDGKGTLKLDNGLVFQPNDHYLLENEKFRLYYTSECDESQSLTITVEDNFGNSFEWETDFNNDSDAEEVPSGNDTLNTVKGGVYQ